VGSHPGAHDRGGGARARPPRAGDVAASREAGGVRGPAALSGRPRGRSALFEDVTAASNQISRATARTATPARARVWPWKDAAANSSTGFPACRVGTAQSLNGLIVGQVDGGAPAPQRRRLSLPGFGARLWSATSRPFRYHFVTATPLRRTPVRVRMGVVGPNCYESMDGEGGVSWLLSLVHHRPLTPAGSVCGARPPGCGSPW